MANFKGIKMQFGPVVTYMYMYINQSLAKKGLISPLFKSPNQDLDSHKNRTRQVEKRYGFSCCPFQYSHSSKVSGREAMLSGFRRHIDVIW